MNAIDGVLLILVVGLFAYLLVALLTAGRG
ncbi:K(+)-transporting ATPase subunit F [Pseudomonas chengduensis]|uniref:K(+)-transporting ATPase subunit F n=1 Tax=Ectopseudomonas oleovorans TaxID=301 RepID=A0AB35L5H8_ECTOL|nr:MULTISPECIES: K(+)-transporting ATPase subunit F [Pseudomonas]MCR1828636.1 K(+)-transporting ATPase subunit F [Pseudomonas oleovorans]MDH0568646.1 K(+)-transporting ATPase subunit F [Pseudomonas oleovorans]MDH1211270.1 K(+)-transporting ATPase subunit F [Pseudomonas chengduensis]